ncbi:MAG: hypothetical protein IPO27_06630 [Bacteroidetes bacterium]|nr:hypothetical protein [Bacteroidota bacterium]
MPGSKLVAIFFLLIHGCILTYGQTIAPNEDSALVAEMKKYTFLNTHDSLMLNKQAMNSFCMAAKKCCKDTNEQLNIIYIGDSHLQAGYNIGVVRRKLQRKFGNAGRGLVFPYRLAKSNGPYDYVSFSADEWDYRRNVFADSTFTTGIMGFALRSISDSVQFGIVLRSNEGLQYAFKRLQLFTDSCASCKVTVTDSAGLMLAKRTNQSPYIHQFDFDTEVSSFKIIIDADSLKRINISGVNVCSDSRGSLCHSVGVNGATFKSFASQSLFFNHLSKLDAQLVIISLGTNEAFNVYRLDTAALRAAIISMVDSIRSIFPNTAILLTTPPDAGIKVRRKKYKSHTNVAQVAKVIKHTACDKHVACYDLYTAAGSYANWYLVGMMDSKRIHFTRKAYEIQGFMLANQILNLIENTP